MDTSLERLILSAKLHYEKGNIIDAENILIKFLDSKSGNINALQLLANIYQSTQQYEKAIQQYQIIKNLMPGTASCYYNLGVVYYCNQQVDEAIICYERALQIDARFTQAHNNLGLIYRQTNHKHKAIYHFLCAIHCCREFHDAHYNIACIYQEIHCNTLAKQCYKKAIAKSFANDKAHNNLAVLYQQEGEPYKAIRHLLISLSYNQQGQDALRNIALCYQQCGQLDKAELYFKQLLMYRDDNAEDYYYLGNVSEQRGNMQQAQDAYRHACQLDPTHSASWSNLGLLLQKQGQLAEALACYKHACQSAPNHFEALVLIIQCQLLATQWENIAQDIANLEKNYQTQSSDTALLSPFMTLTVLNDQSIQHAIAKRFAAYQNRQIPRHHFNYPHQSKNRITIAYLSPDLRQHAVGLLIHDIIAAHNRERFQVNAYSLKQSADTMQTKIAQSCAKFIDISTLSYQAAAHLIHNDNVDILIDLAGYTRFAKPQIVALRPAPIQCHFLGYPGTLGQENIHYYITHPMATPPHFAPFFSEKFLLLPDTPIAINSLPAPQCHVTRIDFNLPQGAFIFACFNATYRITPACFSAWMQILGRVPDSVLWLQTSNELIKDGLRAQAARHHIASSRLIFSKPKQMTDSWHNLLANLGLDTFAISGGTSGVLNAWSGLPVVTLAGPSPQSRFGAANAVGALMQTMITNSIDEYIDKAITLATQPTQLHAVKEKLEQNRLHAPIFQPTAFCRQLERGFEHMWERYCTQKPVDHITIEP